MRGPYLSLSFPVTIDRVPPSTTDIAGASESAPRSHPNSRDSGLRKTPKVYMPMEKAKRMPAEASAIIRA
jgi:hypothetical protein